MKESIIDEIIEKIISLESGEKFIISDYLKGYDINKKEMFEYYSKIISKINGMYEIPKELSHAFVGLPYNIPLIKK